MGQRAKLLEVLTIAAAMGVGVWLALGNSGGGRIVLPGPRLAALDMQGATRNLSDLCRQRGALLVFLDPTCGRCLGQFHELRRELGVSPGGDIPCFVVLSGPSLAATSTIASRRFPGFSALFDPDLHWLRVLAPGQTPPEAVVIGRNGKVLAHGWGKGRYGGWRAVRTALQALREGISNGNDTGLRVRTVRVIGTTDTRKPEYVFAFFRDLNVDSQGNLFVVDQTFGEVRVFDSSGVYLRTIPVPRGVRTPASVALGDSGDVYLLDQHGKTVYHLDPAGRIVGQFRINFWGWWLRRLGARLYISSFPYYAKQTPRLVHVYSRDGRHLFDFCEPRPNTSVEREYTGGYNGFLTRCGELLVFAFGYPFDLRAFRRDGHLTSRVEWQPPFYGRILDPPPGVRAPKKWWSGFCIGLSGLGPDRVAVLLADVERMKPLLYVVQLSSGQIRGPADLSEYTIDVPLTPMAGDGKGGLYFAAYKPFPMIVKFAVEGVGP